MATVIDLSSRRVVGWAMAEHMRTELVGDALRMAIGARRPAPGLIFHSDRGCQYTSAEFTDLLAGHEITQSLSRPRQCWDCDDAGVGVPVGLTLAMTDRRVLALTCRPAGTPTSVAR